jgi:8-oxo-dGTP pyrophosphatase MutT (NUDIX family)
VEVEKSIRSAMGSDLQSKKREKKGATFIAFRVDGTVLMQFRDNKTNHYPNVWTFPGGVSSDEEDPLDAAVREAYEEYELKLDKKKSLFLLSYQAPYDQNLTEYVYIFPVENNQKPVLKEGADMKWMSLEEINKAQVGFGKKEIILPKLKEFLSNLRAGVLKE